LISFFLVVQKKSFLWSWFLVLKTSFLTKNFVFGKGTGTDFKNFVGLTETNSPQENFCEKELNASFQSPSKRVLYFSL